MEKRQSTDTVLMVPPTSIGYNPETAKDNEFQNKDYADSNPEYRAKALEEWNNAVKTLREHGVNVLTLDLSNEDPSLPPTPDAVFPNNWISTTATGIVFIYPMMSPNRREEVRRLYHVLTLFKDNKLEVKKVVDLRESHPDFPTLPSAGKRIRGFLEGTGSIVIDYINGVLFAARSNRTSPREVDSFLIMHAAPLGIAARSVAFNAVSRSGEPYYHTNVMMSVGTRFAVVCSASIHNPVEKNEVLKNLGTQREIIQISQEQVEKYFCGNILELVNSKTRETLIVMSKKAKEGFELGGQLERLKLYGTIVALDIDTIEALGGGSARCMIAEIFLPFTKVTEDPPNFELYEDE